MTLETRAGLHALTVAILALLLLLLTVEAAGADEAARALDQVRSTYAEAGPFHETLELELVMPDGTRQTRRQDYGVDARGGAFYRLASGGGDGLSIVAREDRIHAFWAHIPERYATNAYAGDFAAALSALEAPQVQLWAPPAIVAAQGGDAADFLEALRFGILQPIESVSIVANQVGSRLEVELRAGNGSAVLGIGRGSGRFESARFVLGEGESRVRATGTFSFLSGEPAAQFEMPELEGRVPVPTLTALEASEYPLGDSAPAITVEALEGEVVDLSGLRGQVIVLDFWATWCVPCWSALEHTEALTAWAKASGLPIRVFAVDSLERTEGLESQRQQARAFLDEKGLELDVLVDHDNNAFAAFHNPGLPSLVIVDPQGRLSDYHSGVLENMTDVIRTRVLELLETSP